MCANPRPGGGKGGQERPGPTWVRRRDSGTHTPNAPWSWHPCTPSPRTRAAGASPADCTQKPARPFYRSLADQTQSRRASSISQSVSQSVRQSVNPSVSATLVVTPTCLARPRAVCSAAQRSVVQCQYLRTQTPTHPDSDATTYTGRSKPSLRAPPLTPMAPSPTATECVAAQGPRGVGVGRGRGT